MKSPNRIEILFPAMFAFAIISALCFIFIVFAANKEQKGQVELSKIKEVYEQAQIKEQQAKLTHVQNSFTQFILREYSESSSIYCKSRDISLKHEVECTGLTTQTQQFVVAGCKTDLENDNCYWL